MKFLNDKLIKTTLGSVKRFRQLTISALILVVLVSLVGCGSVVTNQSTGSSEISSKVKTPENNFSLMDLNGVTHSLTDYIGKKVYIKFWASWCPICLGGLDEFISLNHEIAKDKNVIVLSIVSPNSKGEMSSKDFTNWFKKQGYDFNVLLDEGVKIARQFNVRGYPTSVFINSDGLIMKTLPGHLGNDYIKATLDKFM